MAQSTKPKVAVVVGVGVGIGGAVAVKFAKEGFSVAILARNLTYKGADKLAPLKERMSQYGGKVLPVVCNAAEEQSVKDAFATIRRELGEVDVLVYNAGARKFEGQTINETPVEQFLDFWKNNCFGAFLCTREVLPHMKKVHSGTIIYTGATGSLRAAAGLSSFAVGKFGLRALAQSVARECSPEGIHVSHVIIDGPVDIPIIRKVSVQTGIKKVEELLSPDEVANQYWNLYNQHKTTWTFEMDLRPWVESIYSHL